MNNKKATGGTTSKLSAQNAGAADEEMFVLAFEDIPKVQLYTSKDIENEFSSIKKTLENASLDWEKRIDAMQRIRSIVKEKFDTDEILLNLRTLEHPFANLFKDLRSKVVREACITISYISLKLGSKCDRILELLLPNLINLIQNSVKIMSSSALVALRFIIQNTHSPRLLPLLILHLNSKSRDIRRAITESLYLMLTKWPTSTLDKHNSLLQESIKKGLADADAETRCLSRKAFWSYSNHFKQQADNLFHSLDPVKQKILYNEQFGTSLNGLSNSHSTTSLPGTTSRSSSSSSLARQTALTASLINGPHKSLLNHTSNSAIKSNIPIISPKLNIPANKNSPVRTASAIDIGTRVSLRNRNLVTRRRDSNESNTNDSSLAKSNGTRTCRTKTRISQSQPSSRSTSPTSRLNYLTNLQSNMKTLTNSNGQLVNGTTERRRSGIPLLSSRDSSPNRNLERRSSLSRINNKELASKLEKQGSSERLFYSIDNQMSRNQDFVDTFNGLLNNNNNSFLRQRRLNDDHSDESETSSICSDLSFTSNGRNFEDANEIIRNLSSAHWSDRKEGLIGLQYFLRKSSRPFTAEELKKITDIFTKMLVDPHTKTFSFFLEFLGEYLIVYKQELRRWLFILMTRLFIKLGSDTLGSVQTKINRILDIVQRNFTHQDQFNTIIRFLNDQTQTPTIKTKIIVLHYFHNLLSKMMSNEWVLSNGNDLKISLMKIISWTTDPKSQELRKNAQEVICDLFNLNTVEYLNVLKQLPNTYQDTSCQLTQMKKRFSSDASINDNSTNGKQSSSRRSSSLTRNFLIKTDNLEYENSENFNPDQFYSSVKKTADEIHEYVSSSSMGDNVLNNSTSNNVNTNGLSRTEFDSIVNGNMTSTNAYKSDLKGLSNFLIESNDSKFKRVYSALTIGNNVKEEDQKQAFDLLTQLINNANENDWNKHFKDTLSLIFDKINKDANPFIRKCALEIMSELLCKKTKYFNSFIELTMLRILETSKDTEKEVQRKAELCATTAANYLPGDQMIRILKAIISTSQMPVNLAAIKMLTKVIEKQTSKTVVPLLSEIMPPLIQAYDDSNIAIRKTAVSCMVAIYNCVGEEMNGHLVNLTKSKMKLLELYIEKSRSNSGGSSPISISMKSIKSN